MIYPNIILEWSFWSLVRGNGHKIKNLKMVGGVPCVTPPPTNPPTPFGKFWAYPRPKNIESFCSHAKKSKSNDKR